MEMDVKPEVALLPVCPESQQVEPATGTEDSSSLGMLQCLHCDFTDASPSQVSCLLLGTSSVLSLPRKLTLENLPFGIRDQRT